MRMICFVCQFATGPWANLSRFSSGSAAVRLRSPGVLPLRELKWILSKAARLQRNLAPQCQTKDKVRTKWSRKGTNAVYQTTFLSPFKSFSLFSPFSRIIAAARCRRVSLMLLLQIAVRVLSECCLAFGAGLLVPLEGWGCMVLLCTTVKGPMGSFAS